MRARDVLDIDRFQIGRPEFEYLGSQQEIAPIAGNIAQLLESEQAAPRGGRGHAGTARDVTETECGMIATEGANDRETLGEATHGFTADSCYSRGSHSLDTLGSGGSIVSYIDNNFDIRKLAYRGAK